MYKRLHTFKNPCIYVEKQHKLECTSQNFNIILSILSLFSVDFFTPFAHKNVYLVNQT